MKKKILYAVTKGGSGGAQKYVFDLAQYAQEEDFEVGVLCGEPGALTEKCIENDIPVFILDSMHRDINVFKEIESFRQLLGILRQEKPDILHLNSSKMGALGALAGRIAGVPKIIFTAHGWPFNEDRSWLSKKIIKVVCWVTIILSHKTIVLSKKERWDMVHWVGTKKKLVVIPIGLKPIEFKGKEEARHILQASVLPDSLQRSPEALWFGTLAELHRNKGLMYALKALSEFKEADFIYIILGEGEERVILEKEIQVLGLSQKVFLGGYTKDAATLLKAFDILLFPSIKEGLPYTILEAAYGGLPVIASSVGGIPELIQHNSTGILIPAKDTFALRKALEKLSNDLALRTTMGEDFKKSIEMVYSSAQVFPKTLDVYKDN